MHAVVLGILGPHHEVVKMSYGVTTKGVVTLVTLRVMVTQGESGGTTSGGWAGWNGSDTGALDMSGSLPQTTFKPKGVPHPWVGMSRRERPGSKNEYSWTLARGMLIMWHYLGVQD